MNVRKASKQVEMPEIGLDQVNQVLLYLCDAADLLQAGATCRAWRSSSVQSDAWRPAFVRFWSRRQKPGFVRDCWQQLLDDGLAEPAGLSITSNPSQLLRFSQQEQPNPCAYKDSTSTWHQRFISAAWDMRTRREPKDFEICYDLCYDDEAKSYFPRYWCISGNDLGLGPELQFQQGGTIKRFNDQQSLIWRWRWLEIHPPQGSVWVLEMSSHEKNIEFQFHRSADAGFVLVGNDGTKLCSREKTIEEHIYMKNPRKYQFPRFVQQAVQVMADQAGPSVVFPAGMTSFEHMCVQDLAHILGLRCVISGGILNRRLQIFSRRPSHVVQAIVEQNGIRWPTSVDKANQRSEAQTQYERPRPPQRSSLVSSASRSPMPATQLYQGPMPVTQPMPLVREVQAMSAALQHTNLQPVTHQILQTPIAVHRPFNVQFQMPLMGSAFPTRGASRRSN